MTEEPPPEPVVRVTVDGKLALTTGQAAGRHDREVTQMRVLLHRLGVKPAAHLDGRPIYLAALVDRAIKAMPGKGANLTKAARAKRGSRRAREVEQPAETTD